MSYEKRHKAIMDATAIIQEKTTKGLDELFEGIMQEIKAFPDLEQDDLENLEQSLLTSLRIYTATLTPTHKSN